MIFKNKINLSILVFCILAVCLFIFLVFPLFSEIKESSQELIAQKNNLAVLDEKIKNLENFKFQLREITPALEKLEALFIDPDVPVDFIGFLEKISRDCHINIQISSALPTKIEKDPWPSLTLQIASVSSFGNFLKFLDKLESGGYLSEIQNLNMIRLSESELKSKELEKFSLGDVKTTLSLKVYTR